MLEDIFLENIQSRIFGLYSPIVEVMGGSIYRDLTLRHTGNLVSLSLPPSSTSGWGFSNQGKGELRFNQDGYVDCGNEFRSTSFTLTAWVYNRGINTNSYTAIITSSISGNFFGFGLLLNVSAIDKVTLLIQSSTTEYDINDPNTMSKNTWHYICGTYDGTTGRLYIDGLEKANLSATLEYESGDNLILGDFTSSPNSLGQFTGSLGEVGIYNSALSSSEIRYLWNRNILDPRYSSQELLYLPPIKDYTYVKV